MELALEPVCYRFRQPLTTAYGTLERRDLLRVRLWARNGAEGVGEAAPLERYDGVSLEQAREALEACRPGLRDLSPSQHTQALDACRLATRLPQAIAAVDIALWDLAGRSAGRPVSALLGREPSRSVPVSATIGAGDPAGASVQAASAAAQGYRCLKVKVGVGDDAGRLAAVRAAVGPGPSIRVDANGAWTVGEAVGALESMAAVGIEFAEEPVHGLAELAEVQRRCAQIAIAMDETAA